MKIFIGMTRSDTIGSGSFMHICQLGKHFRLHGTDVVYILGGDGPAVNVLRDLGFNVYSIKRMGREFNVFSDLMSLFSLIFITLKEMPTLCTWHTAKIGALGRISSMLTFRKSYYTPHGVPFVNIPENKGYKVYQRIERILSLLPSKIIGVCDFDKNEYIRIGVPKNKLIVIKNGMPNDTNLVSSVTKKNTHFITAARFEAQKDYITLSKACDILISNEKEFTLSIYGDGPLEDETKKLFSHFPRGVINFSGVVKNFPEKLVDADIFILSSFWEGLPLSIIEAMACKKPVICSDVGGCSDLVVNEKTGFLVPIRCQYTMSEVMMKYIDEPTLIIDQGAKGYILYLREFSLPVMLKQYSEEYGINIL